MTYTVGRALALGIACSAAFAGAASGQSILDEARENLVIYAGPQSDWRGPTVSPVPEPGKRIVYISNDENNNAARA